MPESLSKPRISTDSLEKLDLIRNQLKDEREPFMSYWKKYGPKVSMNMSDWDDPTTPGNKSPQDRAAIYDSTAEEASDTLANGLQSAAFGRQVPWIQTTPEDRDIAKDKDAGTWLQKTDLHLAAAFSRSTFYDASRAFTRCCADFGTGIMLREHDAAEGKAIYKAQHLKNCLIAEDRFGQVDTLFRDFWFSPWEAKALFGEANLPKQIKEDLKDGKTLKRRYTQFIIPKDKWDIDAEARNGKPFYTVYVCEIDRKKAIAEGGYDSRPFYVWRWGSSLDGDVWGVDSPGMIAYSDVLQANAEKGDFSRLVQLAANPPIKQTPGIDGGVKMTPGARNFIRPGQDYAATPVTGDLTGILNDLEQLRTSIRGKYYYNYFLTLQANIERVKTATEVAGIKGEQSAMLAAMTGRLFYEFLEPAVEDLFELEYSYGRLPPVPDALKGQKLRIDLVSPLAQLQKRYMMLNETDEFMVRILQVGQQAPQVMDKVDLDAYADTIAEAYNQDKRVLRDIAEVQNIRKLRAQQQEAMQVQAMQNERAKAQAAVLQAGVKAPEEGSPVAAMMGQQAQGGQA